MQNQTVTKESIEIQDPHLENLHQSDIDELYDAGIEVVPYQKRESTPKNDPFTRYLKIADWLHERFEKEQLASILGDLLNSMN